MRRLSSFLPIRDIWLLDNKYSPISQTIVYEIGEYTKPRKLNFLCTSKISYLIMIFTIVDKKAAVGLLRLSNINIKTENTSETFANFGPIVISDRSNVMP